MSTKSQDFMYKLNQRTRRFMDGIPKGLELFEFLSSPNGRKMLRDATERGGPAVGGVSDALIERFGWALFRDPLMRRFVGMATRAIMDAEGYELARPIGRMRRDKLFSAGAVYRRRRDGDAAALGPDIIRSLDNLTPEQAKLAIAHLRNRLRQGDRDDD